MRNRVSSFCRLFCILTGLLLTGFGEAAPLKPAPQPAPAPPSSDEEDILGPRKPVVIPVPEKPFEISPVAVGGTLAAAALLVLLWWHLRGKRIEVAPAERALTELGIIDSSRNALASGTLADRSADVVRKFVAERFGIAAPRRTTEEFLRELAANAASPLAVHSPLLRGFLKSCDMAKFAGAGFDAAERLALLETARRFIRSSNTPATEQTPPVKSEAA
jgi:hypothetical protein